MDIKTGEYAKPKYYKVNFICILILATLCILLSLYYYSFKAALGFLWPCVIAWKPELVPRSEVTRWGEKDHHDRNVFIIAWLLMVFLIYRNALPFLV